MRRPTLREVRRTTDQFLRTALAARGIGDSEFARLEAEMVVWKTKGQWPSLDQYRKDRFATSDGVYRISKTKATVWTLSKRMEDGSYAKIADGKSRHLCWKLVQRLIVLDNRPSS